MKTIPSILLAIFGAALLPQPEAQATKYTTIDPKVSSAWQKLYQSIDLSDGVQSGESIRLARQYFHTMLGACGNMVDKPTRAKTNWLIKTRIGRGADTGPTIIVNASTGEIHAEGHPTLSYKNEKLVMTTPKKLND